MTTTLNLIISGILFLLIIFYKVYQIKKYKNVYRGDLYYRSKKIINILYFLSVIVFGIMFALNIVIYKDYSSTTSSLTYLVNALSVAILALPLTLQNLYISSFKDEEKYSHTKTIVTNIFDEKIIKKFNKSGIKVITLTPDKVETKIKTITEKEFDSKLISKNLIITTENKKYLNGKIDKDNTIFEFNDLKSAYNKIYNARGIHDNYIRTIKYLITIYLPLILSYIFLSVMGFPVTYNILLVMILKVITIITSEFIYKKLPYDTDIMIRKVKPSKILIGKQETIITIFNAFCIFFSCTIPYMFTISQGTSEQLSLTLLLISYIYSNIFLLFSLISESALFVNIIKSLKNIRVIMYVLMSLGFTFIFNFTTYFNTRNIYLKNYLACILFGLIPIIIFEFTKLARFTTIKGVKKNANKNNKKQRRS